MSIWKGFVRILPKKRLTAGELELEARRLQRQQNALNAQQKEEPQADQDGKINGEYEIIEREIAPARIICPDCGGVTWEGLEFCDKCGGEMNL